MKRIFFLLLLLLPCGIGYAQEVTYSEYDKFDIRDDEYSVAGMCGGRLYCYRKTNSGASLDAYDDSMNKVATVMLDFFPQKIYHAKFITYPDKIIALYQGLESNKVVQYAALLDDRGRLVGKPLELGKIKTGIFGATRSYFNSSVSDNKKTILVYNADDGNNEIEFDGKWISDSLVLLKKSKATFKTDNSVEHGEVNVANDGTVYMAAYTPVGIENYADQYWILSLAQGANKFDAKEMPLNEKFAAAGYMKIDNVNNRIYFGGFYSDKKSGNFDGIIYSAYDLGSKSFSILKFIPFDGELQSMAGNHKNHHPFNYYQVRQLIVKNDGGFVMISESEFITTRSNYTPGFGYYSFYNSPFMNSVVHEYHYNDIMALSYNKDGGREWGTFIPKDQYSQEDAGVFSSYALLNSGGTLAFIFNDFNINRSQIKLATLDPDGKSETHFFAPEGNDYPDWLPRSAKQVASRVMVVPCFHKKQICFAKVVF